MDYELAQVEIYVKNDAPESEGLTSKYISVHAIDEVEAPPPVVATVELIAPECAHQTSHNRRRAPLRHDIRRSTKL